MVNTVQAGTVWFSEEKQDEISICLSCPLPDCKGIESPECPLWQEQQRERKKRDVQRLISAWWAKTSMSDNSRCET